MGVGVLWAVVLGVVVSGKPESRLVAGRLGERGCNSMSYACRGVVSTFGSRGEERRWKELGCCF